MGEPDLDARATETRGDWLLVAGAVAATYGSVALALLALLDPVVSRLRFPLVLCPLVALAATVLAARRAGACRIAGRWAGPIAGLLIGSPLVAGRMTWSYPDLGLVLLVLLPVVALVQLILVSYSIASIRRTGWLSVAGIGVVAATWVCIVVGLPGTSERRVRVDLAAPDLVAEAQGLLEDPRPARPDEPFIAVEHDGPGRVVGWEVGVGFLGGGQGLIWDPDGIVYPAGAVRTTEGYPWYVGGTACEPITEDWLYCHMQ